MESTTTDSMCRCCAAEGIFKDIKTSYHWMGEEEVYGDMLRECFDVKLATIEEGGICEVCISQLRNAANFKKQVLHTEKKFKRYLESRRFKPTEVKEELSGDNGNSSDDDRGAADSEEDEDYVPEFEIPIKTESPEESKSRKRTAKASTSRAKKSRVADEDKRSPDPERPTSAAASANPIEEMSAHRKKVRDIQQVLLCSSGTPVRLHAVSGYKCSYCEMRYPQPDRLKKHTLEEHDDVTEARFLRRPIFCDIPIVKLDITSLRCKLCYDALDNMNSLIEHLNGTHSKHINEQTSGRFLPFRFLANTLHCGICSNTFTTFKSLEEHLNLHMKVFKCYTCNEIFKSKGMLVLHSKAMHNVHDSSKTVRKIRNPETRFICTECGETFPTRYNQRVHVKKVHRTQVYYECKICDRAFHSSELLRIHTRRDHMLERLFECDICGKGFFSKGHMMKHTLSHSKEMKFSCNVCGKAFKFQSSLAPHMMIHSGVRRFECQICLQKFVQKGSWQGHMRSAHKVEV